jgi:hypothetical protein
MEREYEMSIYSGGGTKIDLLKDTCILEVITPRQNFYLCCGIGSFILGLFLFTVTHSVFLSGLAFGGVFIAIGLYYKTESYYFIDNNRRSIDYFIKLGDNESRETLCRFDEIHSVTTSASYNGSQSGRSFIDYAVVIVTREGKILEGTKMSRNALSECNEIAATLAAHFEASYTPGEEGQSVQAAVDPQNGEVQMVFTSSKEIFDGKVNKFLLAVSPIIVAAVIYMIYDSYTRGW